MCSSDLEALEPLSRTSTVFAIDPYCAPPAWQTRIGYGDLPGVAGGDDSRGILRGAPIHLAVMRGSINYLSDAEIVAVFRSLAPGGVLLANTFGCSFAAGSGTIRRRQYRTLGGRRGTEIVEPTPTAIRHTLAPEPSSGGRVIRHEIGYLTDSRLERLFRAGITERIHYGHNSILIRATRR